MERLNYEATLATVDERRGAVALRLTFSNFGPPPAPIKNNFHHQFSCYFAYFCFISSCKSRLTPLVSFYASVCCPSLLFHGMFLYYSNLCNCLFIFQVLCRDYSCWSSVRIYTTIQKDVSQNSCFFVQGSLVILVSTHDLLLTL